MLGAPVHERIKNDAYHTIDPRCIAHLDKVWPLRGREFIEPMAGYGQLLWDVEACGGVLLVLGYRRLLTPEGPLAPFAHGNASGQGHSA